MKRNSFLKRTPLKRGTNTLKQGKGLKSGGRIKVKPKTEEQKREQQEQYERDVRFYTEEVWNKRPHYCQACNKWLGNEPNLCFFDHLLPKSQYPELRYEPENLYLTCSQHHSEKEAGFPHPKHQEAINKVKEKFL